MRSGFEQAGITVSQAKVDQFFLRVDANHDGYLTFDEWRYAEINPGRSNVCRALLTTSSEFLLFIPAQTPGLRAVLSYYSSSVKVNAEGDVQVGDETIESLGTTRQFLSSLFGVFKIIQTPPIRHRPPDARWPPRQLQQPREAAELGRLAVSEDSDAEPFPSDTLDARESTSGKWMPMLTAFGFNPGYFLAGGISGIVSRTSTAPLDRLKVYLIAQTDTTSKAVEAMKKGSALQATKHVTRPLQDAMAALWRAGGIRSLFAGEPVKFPEYSVHVAKQYRKWLECRESHAGVGNKIRILRSNVDALAVPLTSILIL